MLGTSQVAQNNVSSRITSGVLHPPRRASSSLLTQRLIKFSGDLTQLLVDLGSAVASEEITPAELERRAIGSVRNIISARTLRNKFLPSKHFADPAWDIMLDLTLARAEARNISISSACIAANVPTTTALRWLSMMIREGLVDAAPSSKGNRRKYVRISDEHYICMLNYSAELLNRRATG